ncbi:MAG: HAD-IC family P-type ATPase [Clostridium fessum]
MQTRRLRSAGKQLGIAKRREECMTGAQLETLDEGALEERIGSVSVFARVSPEHKVRIVRALKRAGCVTAMTGDGVNDAPALKSADIGIAMGKGGTDVARQAADMILTDDNFATIERAIEEGRGIYENIRKSILFLLSSNLGDWTMFAAVCYRNTGAAGSRRTSSWINLITDSLPALALGMDGNDRENLMRQPPRQTGESPGLPEADGFCMAFLRVSDCSGRAGGIFSADRSFLRAQTYAFTVLGLSELFHAVGMRSLTGSAFSRSLGRKIR